MHNLRRHTSLIPIAGLVILLIAGVAILNLWLLVNLYESTARSSSTLSAIQYGLLVTRNLEQQPFFSKSSIGKEDAEQFGQVVDALQMVDPGLEYVSVSERGAIVYHKQARLAPELGKSTGSTANRPEPVSVGRKKLLIGTNMIPVITFTRTLRDAEGHTRDLQVAFRKNVFEREHAGATTAVTTMFRMSLLTLVVSFGLCLLAVIGLVRRELIWQKRQRLNEHLSFAGAMAGSIIHDFRNPMSAMRLDAQLLQHETAKGPAGRPERLLDLANRITQTIDRLDTLLGEFLVIYKPDAATRERFDLNTCVQDCIELVKHRFAKARIQVVLELSPTPLYVQGYPVQFKRALSNVLNNAEHFAPVDSTVTVQTRREHDKAIVAVTDEGPGIPRADRNRIFEIFFSRRPGGTGIGLALAKTAVENCGGAIDVETPSSGKGSRFVIRIPMRT
ncbi:MAG: HAMP domain-containing sensor histidine kinase [Kiritimatiellaeota bacterium]|nr:HAMP domain-containing sensor histidine kinase [Kiritimatiellota bacterium]